MGRLVTNRNFLFRIREVDRRVYFALFWTVLAHGLTRGSQVFRELAIASKFGVSAEADLIVLLLFIPTFIQQYLIANFPQAGIPIYLDEEVQRGTKAAQTFHGSILRLFGGVLLAIGGIIMILSSLHPETWLPRSIAALPALLPSSWDLLFLGVIIFLRGTFTLLSLGLIAHRNFTLPALVTCITPILVSASLFLSSRAPSVPFILKIFALGHLIELFLILVALADERIRPDFSGPLFSPSVRRALKLHFPLILGSSLMGLTTFVERWRVGTLSAGELSAFQYASLIVTLPTIILALPLSQICLTYFSRLYSSGAHLRLAKIVVIMAVLALAGGSIIAAVFSQVAHYLTLHIYAFGVFKSSDHAMISALIAPFAIQIPFYLVGTVLTQALSALHTNFWIALGSALNLVFHFVVSGVLISRTGASGVALTTSLTYLFSATLLSIFLVVALKKNAMPTKSKI